MQYNISFMGVFFPPFTNPEGIIFRLEVVQTVASSCCDFLAQCIMVRYKPLDLSESFDLFWIRVTYIFKDLPLLDCVGSKYPFRYHSFISGNRIHMSVSSIFIWYANFNLSSLLGGFPRYGTVIVNSPHSTLHTHTHTQHTQIFLSTLNFFVHTPIVHSHSALPFLVGWQNSHVKTK